MLTGLNIMIIHDLKKSTLMLHLTFIKFDIYCLEHLWFAIKFSGSLFNTFELSHKKSTATAIPFKREAKREMKIFIPTGLKF